jgi:hypothetical protein
MPKTMQLKELPLVASTLAGGLQHFFSEPAEVNSSVLVLTVN